MCLPIYINPQTEGRLTPETLSRMKVVVRGFVFRASLSLSLLTLELDAWRMRNIFLQPLKCRRCTLFDMEWKGDREGARRVWVQDRLGTEMSQTNPSLGCTQFLFWKYEMKDRTKYKVKSKKKSIHAVPAGLEIAVIGLVFLAQKLHFLGRLWTGLAYFWGDLWP